MAGLGDIDDPVSATLQSWADRELAPWRSHGWRRTQLERQLFDARHHAYNLRIYRFAAGTVILLPPVADAPENAAQENRAHQYLTFFRDIVWRLPAGFNATICISVKDKVVAPRLPVFGFQRSTDETWLLMPDIDFLIHQFYETPNFHDSVSYLAKMIRAVFAGATTGGVQSMERLLAGACPRVRAAAFFDGRLDVDFRLPKIVQVDSEATRAWLEALPFCQRPELVFTDQFKSRFMISMDGNGATCSRVAVALASHSVLLKYHSEEVLYYFDGLVPHVHYVPITEDAEVLDVLAAEREEPGRYLPVAEAGRRFAAQYLTRNRVIEYMVRLLAGYAAMLDDGDAPPPRTLPRRVVAVARAADGSEHFSETQDWVGVAGSGVALTSFKLLCQPRAEAPRLIYQASTQGGGFLPTVFEGAWCGDGTPLLGIRLENPRAAGTPAIAIEARFTDGTLSRVAEMGVECRAESGADMEAFRVELL